MPFIPHTDDDIREMLVGARIFAPPELGEHRQGPVEGVEDEHALAGDRLGAAAKILGAVIEAQGLAFLTFVDDDRQPVGATDQRALLVDRAASVDEQRAAVGGGVWRRRAGLIADARAQLRRV